jgi:hypothetical protein
MIRSKEDLGDELCNFCPRDENKRGVYSLPGGFPSGCEGANCCEAYENYLEANNENIEAVLKS